MAERRSSSRSPDGDPTAPIDRGDLRRARSQQLAAALRAHADPVARREFLTRMGATIALAGLGGCTRAPREEIVPYVHAPVGVTPGIARIYATASTLDGYATGVLVESHVGRPTKVEGNPLHPASLGASGAFEQASLLGLYEPSRARGITEKNSPTTWTHLRRALETSRWTREQGAGLWLLLEPTSSPTARVLLDRIRQRLPRATVLFHSPTSPVPVWEGARIAFGRVLEPRLSLERADVIVSLDSDFLGAGPAMLRLAREFADRRDVQAPTDAMNRLYVVEPLYTITGASADHRLRVGACDVLAVAALLAKEIGLPKPSGAVPPNLTVAAAPHEKWIAAVARDLVAHRGRSLIIAGDAQPPEVHALVHVMNAYLGNLGVTVTMAPSPIVEAGEASHDLSRLTDALGAGEVDTLVICGTNAVYASPAERGLGMLLPRARQSVYLGAFVDETAEVCTFTVAQAHQLESWGDARAFDGTVSIIQPLIAPLFDGRTELDVLSLFTDRPDASAYDLVRERFRNEATPGRAAPEVERAWRNALRRGVVDGTAIRAVPVTLDVPTVFDRVIARAKSPPPPPPPGTLELVARPDPRVHDGRFASNAWLLELPAPITKLTWTNAATLSPATAAELGVATGDEVELRSGVRSVKAPVFVVPGQAEGIVGLTLGWGRRRGADVAKGRGADAFALLTGPSSQPLNVEIRTTGAKRDMPITQTHHQLHGRDQDILQHMTLAELREPSARRHDKKRLALFRKEPGPARWQWAMAIDLSRCTGCGACVVACQAENNVPTVGPDGVYLNREMHWLRIDTYVTGDQDDPQVVPQPMLCQHCEMAPCEYVCPVNATVHSPDGLNEMVYNRCVGTRFCSNNCPYKVRRFNWFDYHEHENAVRSLAHNPDVTVRQRGVMEKCTFCVQRLREFEIKADQGRAKAMPQTACQQACPTRAIVFGDVQDEGSLVTRLHQSDRAYGALANLGTEPRVRYLARVRNVNPELA
jgi:molybdopterin-containing oxidoreductase family iron-sulfur binding subunit